MYASHQANHNNTLKDNNANHEDTNNHDSLSLKADKSNINKSLGNLKNTSLGSNISCRTSKINLQTVNPTRSFLSTKTLSPLLLSKSGLSLSPRTRRFDFTGSEFIFDESSFPERHSGDGVSFAADEDKDSDEKYSNDDNNNRNNAVVDEDRACDNDDVNDEYVIFIEDGEKNVINEKIKEDDDEDEKDENDESDVSEDEMYFLNEKDDSIEERRMVDKLREKLKRANQKDIENELLVKELKKKIKCHKEKNYLLERSIECRERKWAGKIEKIERKYQRIKIRCKQSEIGVEFSSEEESERREVLKETEKSDKEERDVINSKNLIGKTRREKNEYDWCYKILYEISIKKLIYLENKKMDGGVGEGNKSHVLSKSLNCGLKYSTDIESVSSKKKNSDFFLTPKCFNSDYIHVSVSCTDDEANSSEEAYHGRRISSCPDLQDFEIERLNEFIHNSNISVKNEVKTKILKMSFDVKSSKNESIDKNDITNDQRVLLRGHLSMRNDLEESTFSRQSVQYRHVKPRKTSSVRVKKNTESEDENDVDVVMPAQSYTSLSTSNNHIKEGRTSFPIEASKERIVNKKTKKAVINSNYDRLCVRRNGLGSLRLKSLTDKSPLLISHLKPSIAFTSYVKSSKK